MIEVKHVGASRKLRFVGTVLADDGHSVIEVLGIEPVKVIDGRNHFKCWSPHHRGDRWVPWHLGGASGDHGDLSCDDCWYAEELSRVVPTPKAGG